MRFAPCLRLVDKLLRAAAGHPSLIKDHIRGVARIIFFDNGRNLAIMSMM
jgi:hypothetical protein